MIRIAPKKNTDSREKDQKRQHTQDAPTEGGESTTLKTRSTDRLTGSEKVGLGLRDEKRDFRAVG